MDHISNNRSYMQYQSCPPGAFGGASFPSQLTNFSLHTFNGDEELTQGPDIVKNVQLLLDAGLDLRTIFKLRQIKYRNALNILADAEDDELCATCEHAGLTQPRQLPQQIRGRLSQGSSVYPHSRVPSLISDRSGLRSSGILSTPVQDLPPSRLGYASDMSPMAAQWAWGDEMSCVSTKCTQDSTMDYLTSGEEQQSYPLDPPCVNDVGAAYSQRQYGFSAAMPAKVELAFQAPAANGSIPQIGGEQGFVFTETAIRAPFIAEQNPTRDQNGVKKSRFPCPVQDCQKDFSSPKEFAKHLIGDHDRDSKFNCNHLNCAFWSHRLASCKRHHSKAHSDCQVTKDCTHVNRLRVKKHWACGLCLNLEVGVHEFATHYKSHFEYDDIQKSDIRVSNIIRSLLMQDATKDKWERLNVDGYYPLSWDGKDVAEIREALEYETYRATTFDVPGVVDRLLEEVIACGTHSG
ncbi:hypothetical protein FOPE_09603 [Fonsecaea pedrosoi]|nr:hypothetical protein FOPE_09603 [Fonsecaea pedrosoi]